MTLMMLNTRGYKCSKSCSAKKKIKPNPNPHKNFPRPQPPPCESDHPDKVAGEKVTDILK